MKQNFLENKVIDNIENASRLLKILGIRLTRIYEFVYDEKVVLTDDENKILAEARENFYGWRGFTYNGDNKSLENVIEKLGDLIDKINTRIVGKEDCDDCVSLQ